MINNVILIGHFKGFSSNNKLLLKIEASENEQIVKINIASELKDKIVKFIKTGDVVGIKGFIELNNADNIIIVATKITFLSKKMDSK